MGAGMDVTNQVRRDSSNGCVGCGAKLGQMHIEHCPEHYRVQQLIREQTAHLPRRDDARTWYRGEGNNREFQVADHPVGDGWQLYSQGPKDAVVVGGPIVAGVGPDAPTVTNEAGAKQSKVPYRMELIDARAQFEMARVLAEGADKYGAGNWRGIPVADHLNHLLVHVYAYLAGDTSDDHLAHAMCRAMFAQAVTIENNPGNLGEMESN